MRNDFLPYGLHDLSEDDIAEAVKVLKSDWITSGPKIDEFEKKFCEYTECKYAAAVNSGTAALDIAVGSLNLNPKDEIITTPFTFVATANSILYNRCRPVFADIKKDTYNLDPERVKEKITKNTKAIICVDFAGQPCDLDELKNIVEDANICLIEDASHAVGSEYKGQKIGSISDITTFSFHPVKHITTGEGGMIATNNKEFYKKMKMLRNHGIDKEVKERFGSESTWAYDMKFLGKNYRITDFQATLGIKQLERLDEFIERRRFIVEEYKKAFESFEDVTPPFVKKEVKHAWHLYTLLLNKGNRDDFFTKMRSKNIGVNVHYIPIYHHTYYKENFGFEKKDFPVTEDIFKRIITLPLFPKMTKQDIKDVIDAVHDSIENEGD